MESEKIKDFDEIISFLGNYGRFQILLIVLLSLCAVPSGYMAVLMIFLSDTPSHQCKVGIKFSNSSGDAEGPLWERSSLVGPDSCSRYKLQGNWTEGIRLSNDTEQCLDGWFFSPERYTIVSEWDLVCDNAWKVPFSNSLFFVGVLFGSFICGHLSDRFGRKPVLFFTMALLSATALIQATSNNWIIFCVLNCLRGLGQVSSYIVGLVLGSEILSPSSRVTFTLLGNSMGFGIGCALLPAFAYVIRGWRMLLVATAIPAFLLIPTWWVIPESPRWLIQKGRVEEAEHIIRLVAKKNRVPAPEVIFMDGACSELMPNKDEAGQTYSLMDLIRTPNMRNITLLGLLIWMVNTMVYYGLSLSISNLKGDIYLNCFISAAIDILAFAATWFMAGSMPRPILLFSSLTFSGIMLLIIKLVPEDMPVMFQVFALIGKIGVSVSYSFIFVFFAELVPTVVRTMGLGVFSTAGRVGTVICPYIIHIGIYSKILPYIIFGVFSIMASIWSLLLPDTRDCKLPDLISQAKPIRIWRCRSQRENLESQQTTGGCEGNSKSVIC